uniref:Uncharacterized protein n=1 Tax=Nitrosopumivirus cobalaminus TaxID=3158414 RepID=A0AAU7N656_9VIRU
MSFTTIEDTVTNLQQANAALSTIVATATHNSVSFTNTYAVTITGATSGLDPLTAYSVVAERTIGTQTASRTISFTTLQDPAITAAQTAVDAVTSYAEFTNTTLYVQNLSSGVTVVVTDENGNTVSGSVNAFSGTYTVLGEHNLYNNCITQPCIRQNIHYYNR